ncbi:hypothetical protein AKJ47_01870 [candidate division MSBL1 archaeon SCGC-AAA261G05]|uniref:Sulfur carrier protein FdhD n=2 Tax=candidate division MSBL1 TaxID=215777 RepID=A0A133V146_9EURY|nr:hypothetical protein AKJ42_01480 [candidate division MSBL1 archaeon SCGC-AAA261C02]KXB03641.1 hypothetical protein AKJ47_01870 [candidate division MSBL1 archaeon SCGC-AAA261G05]
MKEKLTKNFESIKVSHKGREKSNDHIVMEESYDLMVNGTRVASLMASPSDLKELGYGYLLAEGIVESKDQVISVQVRENEIHAFVKGSEKIGELLELRSSGCVGAEWGKEEGQISVDSDLTLTPGLVFKSLQHLRSNVYDKTSGSHSASLISETGEVLTKTVDVGRHNAYDKVIGKALLAGVNLSKTILLSTGRQSAGMVMKAARAGIPVIVSKAAPLSSGVDAAEKTGITLICFADSEKFKIFAGHKRIAT